MQRSSAPVKPAGQTGDTELDLLRKRLARREANYQKLCTKIERTQRKLDKADRTVTRCVKQLTKLERQRRRAEKAKAEAEALLATELTPKPEPKAQHAAPLEPKPKRQRKPKINGDAKPEAGSPGPKLLEDMLNKPSREARAERMKAMGFRRTSKPRQTATDADKR